VPTPRCSDAAVLAQLLLEHEGDVEAALTRYENDMLPRAAEAARRTAFGLDLIFDADAPKTW
jgi:2-polyprenyl-6-methoxyphenol hydroxylase-like FAD-dependent oxidoreductase